MRCFQSPMAVDSNLHEDVFISLLIELNRVNSNSDTVENDTEEERSAFKNGV